MNELITLDPTETNEEPKERGVLISPIENENWSLVEVPTQEDFVRLGEGSYWSPAQKSSDGIRMFDIYKERGFDFYIATNKKDSKEKYAFLVKDGKAIDAYTMDDNLIDVNEVLSKIGA